MRARPCASIKLFCLGTAIALSFTGCSLRLNDHVAQSQHTVSAGAGCLSQAGDVLDKFQKGALSEPEQNAFFDCTHKALSTFLNYADGKNKDSFEPSELGNFLTKYFLQGKPIQPALLSEAMALKAAIVGGPTERLSRDDLRRIMEVCEHVRTLFSSLRPLMPLTAESMLSRGYSGAEFERAMSAFTAAVATFGDGLKAKQGAYPFEHLGGLFRELQTFLYPNGVEATNWTNSVIHAATALAPAKQILIAPPRDQIVPEDWPKIYRLAPRYYASMLRVKFYLASPFNTFQAGGLDTVERLYADFVNTFNYVIDQHPGQLISSDEIDDLVLTFYDQDMLPRNPSTGKQFNPDTARQFIKVVFGRLLGGNGDPNKFSITKDSLSRFEENLRYLLEGAHAAEALYRPRFGDNFVSGLLAGDEIAAVPDSALLGATLLKSGLSREAVTAIKATPESVGTVFDGSGPTVVIPEHGRATQFSFVHLLKIHALRALNRLLMGAYGTPGSNALTPDQIDGFVGDVLPMLKELNMADDSIKASVSKRLREASLFLYASDGGTNLSMNEALEMEALLLSTVQNAPHIHQTLADACGVAAKKDAQGRLLTTGIPVACFREQFVSHLDRIWSYIPGFANYALALAPADRLKLFDTLSAVFHKPLGADDTYTISDTQSFLQLPYYVELLFSRFDKNGDGQIDNAEAAVAFPVFQPFIADKASAKGYTNPKDHLAIYNFLLSYRELPTDDKWDYALRRYLLGDKAFTDDRGQVVAIFEKLLSM